MRERVTRRAERCPQEAAAPRMRCVGRGRGARGRRGRWATGCGSSRTAATHGSWRRRGARPSCCRRRTSTTSRTGPSRAPTSPPRTSARADRRETRAGRARSAERKRAAPMARAPSHSPLAALAADRPVPAAAARQQHRGTTVLLGLGGTCGIALAADARPGPERELVLAAVGAAAADRARVTVRLAGGDLLQSARARRASGPHACRASAPARGGCACAASGSRAPARGRTSAAGRGRAPSRALCPSRFATRRLSRFRSFRNRFAEPALVQCSSLRGLS